MYNVYIPYKDIDTFSYYYYNDNLSLIYATNDFNTYDIINVNQHYNIISSDNSIDLSDKILIDNSLLTNNWTYRNDLSELLICLLFFVIFFFGTPLFIFSRLFKKRY